jgi:hypothetical protein
MKNRSAELQLGVLADHKATIADLEIGATRALAICSARVPAGVVLLIDEVSGFRRRLSDHRRSGDRRHKARFPD